MACVLFLAGLPAAGQPAGVSYQLGPGDVLEISVWGFADLTRLVTIGPDGEIALPLVGSFSANRVTVEHLRSVIAKAYADYILDPKVAVVVKEFRKIRVSTLGQVTRPGVYELQPGARLLDAIAAAGGLTEAAAVNQVQLIQGETTVVIDGTRALAGEQAMNVPLRGGETVLVPEDFANLFAIQGEVAHPGRFRLKGEMHVLDALLLAGGLTDRASVTQARLVRATGAAQDLLLDDILLRQDLKANILLQPGDTLFIPEDTNNRFYVIGDVHNPGVFAMKGDVTMLQAVAMAGGPQARGNATANTAYILRRGAPSPSVTAGPSHVSALPNGHSLLTLDLGSVMRTGEAKPDVPVQSGDVIIVPQTKLSAFEMFLNILAGVAYVVK
jgi:polysaccharide export outer membrane protein